MTRTELNHKFAWQLFLIFLIMLLMLSLTSCQVNSKKHRKYGVLIGISDNEILNLKGYETLVIDADFFSRETIEQIHKNSNKNVYSYLNIGSIEIFRNGYAEFEAIKIGAYENWPEERWVDVSKPEWRNHIFNAAKALAENGIDGFFLDNADVYYVNNTPAIYQGILGILRDLHKLGLPLIINGGDVFITEAMQAGDLRDLVYGINQETVFTSINFNNGTFGRQTPEDRAYLHEYLSHCKTFGLQIYLLEYGASSALKRELEAFCLEQGYICAISPSLQLDKEPY